MSVQTRPMCSRHCSSPKDLVDQGAAAGSLGGAEPVRRDSARCQIRVTSARSTIPVRPPTKKGRPVRRTASAQSSTGCA
jgi:hypothetical protein